MKMFPVLFFAAVLFAHGAGFDHSHRALDTILKQQVEDGRVDYRALKENRQPLDDCLRQLGAVTETGFKQWTEPQQLAFLINLYNAATLQLIIDHYPVKSIKDIGGLLKGPWKQEFVPLFGRKVTLDHLEHEVLRAKYDEPRIHFGLVCAAKGCPPLRPEAFTAEQLETQLDEQGRLFLRDPKKNRVEARTRTVYLSPIFKWFSEDFERSSGSILKFVARYFEAKDQEFLNTEKNWRIRYTDYDWSLNEVVRPQP